MSSRLIYVVACIRMPFLRLNNYIYIYKKSVSIYVSIREEEKTGVWVKELHRLSLEYPHENA